MQIRDHVPMLATVLRMTDTVQTVSQLLLRTKNSHDEICNGRQLVCVGGWRMLQVKLERSPGYVLSRC